MEANFHVVVDPSLSTPIFEQIYDCICTQVDAGICTPGTRLPATRVLATELGVAVNTVAKAYKKLEIEGVIVARGRAGTFVNDRSGSESKRKAVAFVACMKQLGLSRRKCIELVENSWH